MQHAQHALLILASFLLGWLFYDFVRLFFVPRFRRWRNLRKPPKAYVPGMTLQPGESTKIDIPMTKDLVEELAELERNGATVTFEADATRQTDDGCISEIIVKVDGRIFHRAQIGVKYE